MKWTERVLLGEEDRRREGALQTKVWWGGEERIKGYFFSFVPRCSVCPSPSLIWTPPVLRGVCVSALSTWHLLTVIMYSLLLICYGSESILLIHQLSHIVTLVYSLHCFLSSPALLSPPLQCCTTLQAPLALCLFSLYFLLLIWTLNWVAHNVQFSKPLPVLFNVFGLLSVGLTKQVITHEALLQSNVKTSLAQHKHMLYSKTLLSPREHFKF